MCPLLCIIVTDEVTCTIVSLPRHVYSMITIVIKYDNKHKYFCNHVNDENSNTEYNKKQ
jgi:hypothetical protein